MEKFSKRGSSFLESEIEYTGYKNSMFAVIPCPHEKTTSYGKGTKLGPKAILNASYIVENFDEELKCETYKKGIHTLPPTEAKDLYKTCKKVFFDKKIPFILGGEHSLSPYPVKAAKEFFKDLSVLQFDAHADLRETYEGKKESHACAVKRILEICPAVQVGIRNLSQEEWEFARESGQKKNIFFAEKLLSGKNIMAEAEKIISKLSKNVYITFDVDALDPSIMPSTGTPEPGGLFYYDALSIIREVCRKKNVVGADFVELMPIKGLHHPDFTVAKMIYKTMGYIASFK